ncbi:MAG: pilus assembly protein PilM [Candidatus Omnitrophota bacterium]
MENILGLEITEDKIKLIEARSFEKKWEALSFHNIGLPANSLKDGVIIEPKVTSEKISAFLKEKKISAKRVIALISPPYVFSRLLRLPQNLSESQIRLNLEAEVNQYQNFSGKDNIIDFRKIEEVSEEGINKANVLFATCPRMLTESYLKTLELAGLDLVGADLPIFSVMRLLDDVDLSSSSLEATLLICIGQKFIEMCVIKGNRPRFLHSVEVDTLDFEKAKEEFVNRILSGIKLVVNFYQVRFIQGEQISRIIVNPLDEKYSQIHAFLQEKLPQIPIRLSRPLAKIQTGKEGAVSPDELRFSFSALLGAVLRFDSKDLPFNLNLLLEQKIKRRIWFRELYLLLISLGALFIAMLLFGAGLFLKINIQQKKLGGIGSKLEEPSEELQRAIKIKEKSDLLESELREASMLVNKVKAPVYFRNIAKAMLLATKELWLTEIDLEREKRELILTGESKTEKSIFEYISGLTKCGYFNSVELVSSRNQDEAIQFVIQCAIK